MTEEFAGGGAERESILAEINSHREAITALELKLSALDQRRSLGPSVGVGKDTEHDNYQEGLSVAEYADILATAVSETFCIGKVVPSRDASGTNTVDYQTGELEIRQGGVFQYSKSKPSYWRGQHSDSAIYMKGNPLFLTNMHETAGNRNTNRFLDPTVQILRWNVDQQNLYVAYNFTYGNNHPFDGERSRNMVNTYGFTIPRSLGVEFIYCCTKNTTFPKIMAYAISPRVKEYGAIADPKFLIIAKRSGWNSVIPYKDSTRALPLDIGDFQGDASIWPATRYNQELIVRPKPEELMAFAAKIQTPLVSP